MVTINLLQPSRIPISKVNRVDRFHLEVISMDKEMSFKMGINLYNSSNNNII